MANRKLTTVLETCARAVSVVFDGAEFNIVPKNGRKIALNQQGRMMQQTRVGSWMHSSHIQLGKFSDEEWARLHYKVGIIQLKKS